jgi:hypothetical protein
MNVKMIVAGKFRRSSNKNAIFSLPFEESKEIDYGKEYTILVIGPAMKVEKKFNKVVII